ICTHSCSTFATVPATMSPCATCCRASATNTCSTSRNTLPTCGCPMRRRRAPPRPRHCSNRAAALPSTATPRAAYRPVPPATATPSPACNRTFPGCWAFRVITWPPSWAPGARACARPPRPTAWRKSSSSSRPTISRRSVPGSPLYPAFPYPQYTAMSRADSDALYAYLMSLPAIDTPNRPHELRFPYDQRWLLSAWRALYFKPGQATPVTTDDADVQRGHYLVEVAGHCTACHTPRNRWGATDLARSLQGAVMPDSKWYATPLSGDAAGLADWSEDDIVQVLRTGFSRHGTAAGPMGEVVSHSTQYLHDTDLRAMARYLKSLPAATPAKPPRAAPDDAAMVTGARLYEQHCASCHGAEGEGAPPHWPALAGNASVKAPLANNVVLSILKGGY